MNGYSHKEYEDGSGVISCPDGRKVGTDRVTDDIRHIGIELAFGIDGDFNSKYPEGNNPNIKWPALTESGEYIIGIPEADPVQGFEDVWEESGEDEENDWCFDDEEDDYE